MFKLLQAIPKDVWNNNYIYNHNFDEFDHNDKRQFEFNNYDEQHLNNKPFYKYDHSRVSECT